MVSSDEKWFASLYENEERKLYNLAFRIVWNSQEAMDMVHDGFTGLWKNRQTVAMNGRKAYLYQSVMNQCRKKVRWNKFKVFVSLEPEDSLDLKTPEDTFWKEEQWKTLQLCLQKIPEKYRDVLLLSEIAELSYQEIAKTLAIKEGTVASRKNQALKLLRTQKEKFQ